VITQNSRVPNAARHRYKNGTRTIKFVNILINTNHKNSRFVY